MLAQVILTKLEWVTKPSQSAFTCEHILQHGRADAAFRIPVSDVLLHFRESGVHFRFGGHWCVFLGHLPSISAVQTSAMHCQHSTNSNNSHNSHNNKEKRDNKHELASLDQLHHLIKAMMATLDTAILAAKDMASVSPKHNCSIHDPPIQLTSARLQSDSNNYKLEERGA